MNLRTACTLLRRAPRIDNCKIIRIGCTMEKRLVGLDILNKNAKKMPTLLQHL